MSTSYPMHSVPDEATVREIVALACRAPSVHNTQPWRWVLSDKALHLYADTRRQLMHADTTRRDLVISCGAALHQLEVSAAAAGWEASIERLPNPDDPMQLASVSFALGSQAPSPAILRLAGAIGQRHTDRREPSSWPVPPARLEQITSLCGGLGVLATTVPPHLVPVLYEALTVATRVQNRDDAYLDELLAWTHSRHAEGIPTTSLLTRAAAERQPGSFTRFPAGSLDDHEDNAGSGEEWMLVSTSSDDVLSWLRTGEALGAVWLDCTIAGLSLVPFTQPIEVADTRRTLQVRILNDRACPQLIVRIGWPPLSHEPVPPTPRRPVELVLERDLGRG